MLSKLLTVAGVAGLGYFIYQKYQTVTNFADSLRVYVTDLGLKVKEGKVVVLFKVNMDNPSEVVIPVDQVFVTVFKKSDSGEWEYIANSSPKLNQFFIKAWDTTLLSHSVRLPLMNAISEAFSFLDSKKEYKINIKIHALGQIVEIDSIHTV